MIEYIRHIDVYSLYPHSSFSHLVSSEKWGDKLQAENYLQKYWLSEQEYLSVWKPIQDKIFPVDKSLPDLIYNRDFEMIVFMGGCLFLEEDFKQLQKALLDIEEEYFVIVQHSQDFTQGEPMFRMKYPINITWEELTSGNYISAVLLEMNYNNYYVFGSKVNWGKYSANDYINPFDIIGFKPELSSVFKEYFNQSKEEQKEIQILLPKEYNTIIK